MYVLHLELRPRATKKKLVAAAAGEDSVDPRQPVPSGALMLVDRLYQKLSGWAPIAEAIVLTEQPPWKMGEALKRSWRRGHGNSTPQANVKLNLQRPPPTGLSRSGP